MFLNIDMFLGVFLGGVLMLAEKALAFKTKVCDCDRHTVHWDHESHIFEGFFFFSSNWMMQAQHILPWSTKGSTKIVWRWSQYGDIINICNVSKGSLLCYNWKLGYCISTHQKWHSDLAGLYQKIQAGSTQGSSLYLCLLYVMYVLYVNVVLRVFV